MSEEQYAKHKREKFEALWNTFPPDISFMDRHGVKTKDEFWDMLYAFHVVPKRNHDTQELIKAASIPDENRIIFAGDLHGNENDANVLLEDLVNELLAGKKTTLLLLGDYIHGLKAINGKGKFDRPAYPDKSKEVLSKIAMFRNVLGDAIIPLLGDHEQSLLFPGYEVYKYGEKCKIDLTKDEEILLRASLNNFPLLAEARRISFSHTGSPGKINSIKDVENVKYDFSEIAEGGIIDSLTYGKRATEEIDGKKYEDIRRFYDSDTKQFHKALKLWHSMFAHSGTSAFIYEHDGKPTPSLGGVRGHKVCDNFTIIATTEGDGCENERGSNPNTYGEYGFIDSNSSVVNFGKLGRNYFPEPLIARKHEQKKALNEELESVVEFVYEQKGMSEQMHERFKKVKNAFEQGKISAKSIEYAITELKKFPVNTATLIPDKTLIKGLPDSIKPYFR